MGRPGTLVGSLREPLSEPLRALASEYLQALAEPHRMALLEALTGGEASVQELADRVGLPHQNTSHHLAALWRAGILARRAEGAGTLYEIEDWSAWWVVEQISGWLRTRFDERPPTRQNQGRLAGPGS